MITKKFENYKKALEQSKPKNNKDYYIIIDMENDVIESTLLFDNKESAYNWVRNVVHEIEQSEANEIGEDSYNWEDEFDPYELINLYNDKHGTQIGKKLFLVKTKMQPYQPLDKELELRMSSKKYNL